MAIIDSDVKLKALTQLFSFRDIRNALVGLFVVVGGVGLALTTIWLQQIGSPRYAGYAAGASLIFVLVIIIFVIPPLARNASAEASQMNLPFEMTVGGAIILGLMVIVGFSAWNTGNNLLFLILSFLAASLVVGFIVGNFCLKKLDVKMRFPETIFSDAPTPIIVSLHNRKRIFPTFSVVAEVRGQERESSILIDEIKKIVPEKWAKKIARPPVVKHTLDYFINVPRRDTVENKVEHIFQHRGRFIIKDFELSTKFPFGFFRHRRRLSAQEAEIIIFPRIVPIDEELTDLPLEVGKMVANKRGLGQDLFALRDYQPMDDLRRVDWKATARTNRLIIREFSAEDDKRVTIIFDARLVKDENEKKKTLRQRLEDEQKGVRNASERFENGVGKTASLLTHFTEEQAEIRLMIDAEHSEFGIGRKHLHSCLKRLATVEAKLPDELENENFEENLAEILDERDNSHNFLISTLQENDLPNELVQMAKLIRF